MTIEKFKNYFTINQKPFSLSKAWLMIVVLYVVFVVVRVGIFLWRFDDPLFHLQSGDFLPIWNGDGGLYGYYASQILKGTTYPFTAHYMPGHFLAFLTTWLPFSLDEVIFYAPVFVSSLVVVPIVFVGYWLDEPKLAIYTLLVGGLSVVFYVRTSLGRFDTDTLNMVFMVGALGFMIGLIKNKNPFLLVVVALLLMGFGYWYHSYRALALFCLLVYSFATLLLARGFVPFLAILALIVPFLPWLLAWHKLALIVAIGILGQFYNRYAFGFEAVVVKWARVVVALGTLLIGVVVSQNPHWYERALNYLDKSPAYQVQVKTGETLHFSGELNDVAEAQARTLGEITTYLSMPSPIVVVLGFLGVLLLFWLMPLSAVFTAPFAFVFIALLAGGRFSMFGVFAFAIGLAYWLCKVQKWTLAYLQKPYLAQGIVVGLIVLPLLMFQGRTLLRSGELLPILDSKSSDALRSLKPLNPYDFVLASWSFGWNIWFHTGASTLIDNGRHHYDKFLVARWLFASPRYTAQASRYFLSQCPKDDQARRCELSKHIYANQTPQELDKTIKAIPADREIFFFFHERMLLSANQMMYDLQLQQEKIAGYGMYFAETIKVLGDVIESETFTLNQRTQTIVSKDGAKTKFNMLYAVDSQGRGQVLRGDPKAEFSAVVYSDSILLLIHQDLMSSLFVQTLIFKNIDKQYFEWVRQTRNSVIFKLKR